MRFTPEAAHGANAGLAEARAQPRRMLIKLHPTHPGAVHVYLCQRPGSSGGALPARAILFCPRRLVCSSMT